MTIYSQLSMSLTVKGPTNLFETSRVRLLVIWCKLIRMESIVLFETSRVRLIEYLTIHLQ